MCIAFPEPRDTLDPLSGHRVQPRLRGLSGGMVDEFADFIPVDLAPGRRQRLGAVEHDCGNAEQRNRGITFDRRIHCPEVPARDPFVGR